MNFNFASSWPEKVQSTVAKNNNHYSMVIALLILTTMAGCDSGRNLVGSWACQTQNPNGSISQDNFTFNDDATFSLDSDMQMLGTYKLNDKTLMMTITKIPKMAELGLSTSTEKIITGTINVLTSTELKMDTYVGKAGMHRSSTCRRS